MKVATFQNVNFFSAMIDKENISNAFAGVYVEAFNRHFRRRVTSNSDSNYSVWPLINMRSYEKKNGKLIHG